MRSILDENKKGHIKQEFDDIMNLFPISFFLSSSF